MSCVILGKAVQPYHFHDEALNLRALSLLASIAVGVGLFGLALGDHPALAWARRQGPGVRAAAALVVAAAQLSYTVPGHARAATLEGHPRPDNGREYPALRDYHACLRSLVAELRRPAYADARVLGTFDSHVLGWWSLFGGRFAFAPDVFTTSAPDEVVETRLLGLCATLGMTTGQAERFVDEYYINTLFLGHAKYQASKAHTFAPLSDYAPEFQQHILRTAVHDNWMVGLPVPERRRLGQRYAALVVEAGPRPRLDLIILTNGPTQIDLAPVDARFRLTYQDPVFRVFRAVD